jgi:ABC-type transport system involved in cytochrome c biogenesis permease subunit
MIRFFALFVVILFCTTVSHANDLPVQRLGALPVQHDGRIKTLERFAHTSFQKIHGKDSSIALAWLVESLFRPEQGLHNPVVLVKNKNIRRQLGLKKQEQPYYTVKEVMHGISTQQTLITALNEKQPKELTPEQNELYILYQNSTEYLDLLNSFSMLLPLTPNEPSNYLDRFSDRLNFAQRTKAIAKEKGIDLQKYTEDELDIVNAQMQIERLEKLAQTTQLFKIIAPTSVTDRVWLTPWQSLLENRTSSLWFDVARAYRTNDLKQWNKSVQDLVQTTESLDHPSYQRQLLKIEYYYTSLKPFVYAEYFYMISFLLFCLALIKKKSVLMIHSGQLTLIIALLLHTTGLVTRSIILQRPPVGTLYESILFVSLIIGMGLLWIGYRKKEVLYQCGSSASSLALLFLAPIVNQQGDSLEVLVAVLNTNFWLATHVIIITMAYGICLLSSFLANIQLYRFPKNQDNAGRLLRRTNLFALLLTCVGTILGGIWADQSWGRFWGWDPKENGALLLVLWLIWLIHGRLSGDLKELAYTACSAALSIIVGLSWFGVNLLSVGLHSYGFIAGLSFGLFGFCAIQLAWIFFCISMHKKR